MEHRHAAHSSIHNPLSQRRGDLARFCATIPSGGSCLFSKRSTIGAPKLKPFLPTAQKGHTIQCHHSWKVYPGHAIVDLLRCPLEEAELWAKTGLTSLFHLNRGKFTKNKNDHWSSAAGLSMPRYTKPWHRTHRLLPCIIRELRQVCWNVAGLWFRVLWGFRTLQIPLIWLPATLKCRFRSQ